MSAAASISGLASTLQRMPAMKPTATVKPTTVESLRDAARGLVADEDRRSDSLNARGTALTGFVGVILSLAAAAGAGFGASPVVLDHWARTSVTILITVALALLVASVGAVVLKVIRPLPGITISLHDTDKWIEPAFTDLDQVLIDGYLLDGYTQSLRVERDRNNGKAKWLRWSYVTVCLGLVCVAGAGGVATVDRYARAGKGPTGSSHIHAGHHSRARHGSTE